MPRRSRSSSPPGERSAERSGGGVRGRKGEQDNAGCEAGMNAEASPVNRLRAAQNYKEHLS